MICFNVLITNDSNIRRFKHKWFNVDEVTDVISFSNNQQIIKSSHAEASNDGYVNMYKNTRSIRQKEDNEDLVGEIVVNEDAVRRNAEEYGVTFEQEMARVVAHGVLHIYGYTDDTEEGKLAMKAIEDTIVDTISTE